MPTALPPPSPSPGHSIIHSTLPRHGRRSEHQTLLVWLRAMESPTEHRHNTALVQNCRRVRTISSMAIIIWQGYSWGGGAGNMKCPRLQQDLLRTASPRTSRTLERYSKGYTDQRAVQGHSAPGMAGQPVSPHILTPPICRKFPSNPTTTQPTKAFIGS